MLSAYEFHIASTLAVLVVGLVLGESNLPKSILFAGLSSVIVVAVVFLLRRGKSKAKLFPFAGALTFAVVGFLFALNHKDASRELLKITIPKDSSVTGTIVRLNRLHRKKFRTTLEVLFVASPNHRRIKVPDGATFEVVTPFEIEGFSSGEVVQVRGNLLTTKRIKDKNYQNYLLRRKQLGTLFTYSAEDIVRVDARKPTRTLKTIVKTQRDRVLLFIERKLERYVDSPAVGLAYGITTGDKSKLPKKILEDFRLTGTFHVLAVSGMHASLISLLFYNLFRFLGMRRRTSLSLVMFLVLPSYLFITGGRISIVRTYIMLLLGFALMVSGRRTALLVVLQLTFLLVVLVHPTSLYGIGLQLSFSAVFGIFTMIELLRVFRIRGRLVQFVLVSLAAQSFTNPIACYYFGYINPFAVAYNLFVPFCIGVSLAITITLLLSPIDMLNNLAGDLLSFLNHSLFWVLEKTKITSKFFYVPLEGELVVCSFWWLAQVLLAYCLWVHGHYLRVVRSESQGEKAL